MNNNVYRVKFAVQSHQRRQTCGGMDSEPTGVYKREEYERLIEAQYESQVRGWAVAEDCELISVELVGKIYRTISIS